MSIKSIFQSIANAIKTKDTTIDTLTPLEMSNAILNIGGDEMTTTTLFENPNFNTHPNIVLNDSVLNYKILLFECHRQYSTQSQVLSAMLSVDGLRYFINNATAPVTNIKVSAVGADGWILYQYVDDTHFNFEIASSNIIYLDRVVGIK